MISAEDVYSYNNQLILPKGSELSDKIITRLEFYSILAIQIEDEMAAKPEVSAPAAAEASSDAVLFNQTPEGAAYSEKIKSTTQFKEFKKSFVENTSVLKGNLHAIVENNAPINTEEMLHSVLNMITEGTTSISLFDMLHNMRDFDDLTYVHCMNVSLICNIFGKWLSFNEADLKVVTLAGLLHDIGKLTIPENILKKPSKLNDSEYNIIKTHTLKGYNILKSQNIDARVKNAALMHHEREDGSGYPLAYSGNKIDYFSKIVAIADVYDAMTSARVYRGPQCPFKVVEIFESEGFQKYDSKLILTFLENVCQTYINNRVVLNNGMQGDIVMLNKNSLSRPMIKTLDGSFINLVERKDLYIESLV